MLSADDRLKAVYLSLGLFVSYSAIAVFKEKIFKDEYDGEKFVYPITFAAVQCLITTISAKGMMLTHNHPKNETPQKFYIFVSFFNLLTMITSYMALEYVPFVVLVVGKACKPIPVMIFSAIIARKNYTIQRYFFVSLIAFGVGLFVYKEGFTSSNGILLGNILILTSLLLEGFLAGAQAKMRVLSKPTSINYMFYVNCWTTLFALPLTFINLEGLRFVQFCMRHDEVIIFIIGATLTGTIGHYFSSSMISNFGPLPPALVSTTRKFFTVLLSALIFGNVLSLTQWIATVIIFEALILDIVYGKRKLFKNDEKVNKEAPKEIDGCSERKNNEKVEETSANSTNNIIQTYG